MIAIEELEVFFGERRGMDDASEDVLQMCEWCIGIRKILDDYGANFMESPSLIQTLDFGSFYLGKPSKTLSESGLENEREVEIVLRESKTPTVNDPDFERTHLEYEGREYFKLWKAELGFLYMTQTKTFSSVGRNFWTRRHFWTRISNLCPM